MRFTLYTKIETSLCQPYVDKFKWMLSIPVKMCCIGIFGLHVCSFNEFSNGMTEIMNEGTSQSIDYRLHILQFAVGRSVIVIIGVVEFANAINNRMYGRRL